MEEAEEKMDRLEKEAMRAEEVKLRVTGKAIVHEPPSADKLARGKARYAEWTAKANKSLKKKSDSHAKYQVKRMSELEVLQEVEKIFAFLNQQATLLYERSSHDILLTDFEALGGGATDEGKRCIAEAFTPEHMDKKTEVVTPAFITEKAWVKFWHDLHKEYEEKPEEEGGGRGKGTKALRESFKAVKAKAHEIDMAKEANRPTLASSILIQRLKHTTSAASAALKKARSMCRRDKVDLLNMADVGARAMGMTLPIGKDPRGVSDAILTDSLDNEVCDD